MKKLVSLAVSATILYFIYTRLDISGLWTLYKSSAPEWLTVGLILFIPTTALTALRLKWLSPDTAKISAAEAAKLILAASSLNMVLPSKMGDIAKGVFIADRGKVPLPHALSLVVFEKTCDILSLLLLCSFGLFFYNQKDAIFMVLTLLTITGLAIGVLILNSKAFVSVLFRLGERLSPAAIALKLDRWKQYWLNLVNWLGYQKPLMLKVAAMSIGIWLVHLIQIWAFIRMLGGSIPIPTHLGLIPLAIFAGLMPLTFAGVGTRDAALIYFLQGHLTLSETAALGILCTFRYILPATAGLPFLSRYVGKLQKKP